MDALLEERVGGLRRIGCDTVRISGIVDQSIVDGPGLRMTVFAQGCPHRCAGCHNPSTHSSGRGYDATVDAMVERFDENPLLAGITLSGGEPLAQARSLAPLAEAIKRRNKSVWCYTGYTFAEICGMLGRDSGVELLLRHVDVLVDGRYEESLRSLTLQFRGSSNQRVLNMPQSLRTGQPVLWTGRIRRG